MDPHPVPNRLATTSLTLGLVGWAFYLLQWCFDLTLGLILAFASGGASAICGTILDVLPFVLWLVGVVAGHVALGQIKQTAAPGRGRAVWGLVLNYSGLFFTLLLIVVVIGLLAAGIGTGVLEKLIPVLPKK